MIRDWAAAFLVNNFASRWADISANLLPDIAASVAAGVLGVTAAYAADKPAEPKERTPPAAAVGPVGGVIGYAATDLRWAIYQTASGKEECPHGFNDGPREQYAVLFPDNGRKRSVVDTQLAMEIKTWFPDSSPDPTPFREATGTIAPGLNLDGKVGPHDFRSPQGEPGIDNQMFRALGCVIGYRAPDGVEYIFGPKAVTDGRYNRLLLEVTGVDNLVNDSEVQVNVYRGLDRLLTDATGNKVMAGGTQRIDGRWGAKFIQHYRGKIVNGVLTTEPGDFVFPWMTLSVPTIEVMHGMRLQLKLTPTNASGLIGGYTDYEIWYDQLIRNDSTHHLSNGQISAISLHKAFARLADGVPDPVTGKNTALSSALDANFVQVFLQHPAASQTRTAAATGAQTVMAQSNAAK